MWGISILFWRKLWWSGGVGNDFSFFDGNVGLSGDV